MYPFAKTLQSMSRSRRLSPRVTVLVCTLSAWMRAFYWSIYFANGSMCLRSAHNERRASPTNGAEEKLRQPSSSDDVALRGSTVYIELPVSGVRSGVLARSKGLQSAVLTLLHCIKPLHKSEKQNVSGKFFFPRALRCPLVSGCSLNTQSELSWTKAWLESERKSNFEFASPPSSVRTVQSLGVLTGAQLFSLNKKELCEVSYEEGARVYSHIMMQKVILEVGEFFF